MAQPPPEGESFEHSFSLFSEWALNTNAENHQNVVQRGPAAPAGPSHPRPEHGDEGEENGAAEEPKKPTHRQSKRSRKSAAVDDPSAGGKARLFQPRISLCWLDWRYGAPHAEVPPVLLPPAGGHRGYRHDEARGPQAPPLPLGKGSLPLCWHRPAGVCAAGGTVLDPPPSAARPQPLSLRGQLRVPFANIRSHKGSPRACRARASGNLGALARAAASLIRTASSSINRDRTAKISSGFSMFVLGKRLPGRDRGGSTTRTLGSSWPVRIPA